MTFAVGLTGNLASGKTTCAEIFASFGIIVISADDIAKQLTIKNTPVFKQIVEYFGEEIIDENDGELDRKQLREIIFHSTEKRLWLEALLHPLIREEIKTRVDLCPTPYCIVEIPLLLDKKDYSYLNEVLVIIASYKLQIARVLERDKCSLEQAKAILAIQPKASDRLRIADKVINNDSDLDDLKKQLKQLHEEYLKKSLSLKGRRSKSYI